MCFWPKKKFSTGRDQWDCVVDCIRRLRVSIYSSTTLFFDAPEERHLKHAICWGVSRGNSSSELPEKTDWLIWLIDDKSHDSRQPQETHTRADALTLTNARAVGGAHGLHRVHLARDEAVRVCRKTVVLHCSPLRRRNRGWITQQQKWPFYRAQRVSFERKFAQFLPKRLGSNYNKLNRRRAQAKSAGRNLWKKNYARMHNDTS